MAESALLMPIRPPIANVVEPAARGRVRGNIFAIMDRRLAEAATALRVSADLI
jgi:hypothetical protein